MSSTALENTEKVPGWYIEFLAALLRQAPRPGELSQGMAESWMSGQESLKNVLRDNLCHPDDLDQKAKPAPAPEPEAKLDPIIRVDRSIRPSYPDWVKEVMHPELETVGPAEYDITKLEQWLHDGQKGGKWIEGNKIYAHLKKTDTLKTCLGLRDLEEIQKKGIAYFRKHFAGKAVFAWASVVRGRHGNLSVPYLYESGGLVVLGWRWLVIDWFSSYPALRHAS